jgi:hypothetical protein
MPVQTFIKKPVETDALQWTGTDERCEELRQWIFKTHHHPDEHIYPVGEFIALGTQRAQEVLGSMMTGNWLARGYSAVVYDISHGAWLGVHIDDWIVKGLQNEFYPCAPADFQTIYEAK